jgi:hypothetical protein
MKNLPLVLLAAPLGYILLTGYLLNKVRPLPIAFLPQSGAPERETALAA